MLNMELNISLVVLMQFTHIVDIPELYCTFNEHLVV